MIDPGGYFFPIQSVSNSFLVTKTSTESYSEIQIFLDEKKPTPPELKSIVKLSVFSQLLAKY